MKLEEQLSADIFTRVTEMLQPFLEMLETESQRSQVILLTTKIDEELETLLKKFLKPRRKKGEKEDELFKIYAPLSTFSARISMAHRLGLISRDDADAFDTLRDLRNDCAHKIFDFNFVVSPTRDRTTRFIELTCLDPSRALAFGAFACPQTDEHALIFCCLFHIIYLQRTGERISAIEDRYSSDIFEWKKKCPDFDEDSFKIRWAGSNKA